MNELMNIELTMSSREIAELTGKRHDHVLRDCDNLDENYGRLALPKIGEGYYTHPNTGNQQHRECLLTKMQTFDLMTGYNTELRIKVNRRWEQLEKQNQLDFNNPDTVVLMAQRWRDDYHKLKLAEKKLIEQAPKVELMNRVIETGSLIDIGQVAKVLNLPYGRNNLFKKLRELGILFKSRNEPKQEYVDRGYFKLKEIFVEAPGKVLLKVLVTQKGLEFIARILNVISVQKELALIA